MIDRVSILRPIPKLVGCLVVAIAVEMSASPALANDETPEKSEAQIIAQLQQQLADRYQLLEEKLFALHEFERDNNPMRSKLLRRAYLQSQEKMTASQLAQIARLLGDQNLRDAEDRQDQVVKELEALLTLLESEDRGQRVRSDIRRYQEYLKEVQRLQRMQRGIRAQTESNGNQQRLANSQEKTANRTERLAREIRRNEESDDELEGADAAGDDESVQAIEPGVPEQDQPGSRESQSGSDEGGQEPDSQNPAEPGGQENPSERI